MNLFRIIPRPRLVIKFVLFFIFLLLIQTVTGFLLLQETTYSQVKNSLNDTAARIQSDIKYDNGKWDTTTYNADPQLPYPNASAAYPLYIFTNDGFVVERSKPINGLMDTSNYNQLSSFKFPQNINTVTNENWRVLSKVIEQDSKSYGVIMVSNYNPPNELIETIDKDLTDNLAKIYSQIQIRNDSIDVSKVDIRNIHYDVSFEVVDKFNKVLINNGRTPSFIDTSYIAQELKKSGTRTVRDSITGEEYMILSRPMIDSNKNVVGLMIVGRSVSSISNMLNNYLFFSLILIIVLTLPLFLFVVYALKDQLQVLFTKEEEEVELPMKISFDKKESILYINDKKISIPYASNQFYICKALFSNPSKRWEQDELLEKFGEEEDSSSRKVYDAALAINRKAGIRLIYYEDKTYRINPAYQSLIQ